MWEGSGEGGMEGECSERQVESEGIGGGQYENLM